MPASAAGLRSRMLAAVLALSVVLVAFLIGVWATFYTLFVWFELTPAVGWASVVTAGLVALVGYLEFRHLDTIERFADAKPIDRETAPALSDMTTKVAAMFDVPPPRIAVSERSAPEAMAVGFRPGNIHLVLSRGTIDALDAAKLEAVIAHELAHVANRDAMVMTALSTPVVLADGLRSRLGEFEHRSPFALVAVPLGFVSNAVWIVGRAITARLSRQRERAADRAAAEATGSPSTLAAALRTLDSEIAATPDRDLRAVSGVSSLSILSLEPRELEKVMLGPEGDTEPSYWWLRKRLHRLERWLFVSHPPTEQRLSVLAELEATRSTS
ncbi:MAG: M48 family metalloprotease [Euryarchaeota archaeon]|nr:M48 family metalloprotease [Euryarchaeota archaeon]